MKKIFFIIIVFSLIIGCAAMPERKIHEGWTKKEFRQLPEDQKQFELTFMQFRYHSSSSKMIRAGNKIPMSFSPYAKAIDLILLKKSIEENYGIIVNTKEFEEARNRNLNPVRNGRWLDWKWYGSNKRNRIGILAGVFSAMEGIRLTPRLDLYIYILTRKEDGNYKVISTDNYNVPIGNSSGFTFEDIINGIKQNCYVKNIKRKSG